MTDEQALALAHFMRAQNASGATLQMSPFDLPEGYVYAIIRHQGAPDFHCGIAPNGDVSS